MSEETGTSKTTRFDPHVSSYRPASGKTQDISHVLSSTFEDLYTRNIIGKDTLSNLIKSKNESSSYHDRYVEELQQAHSEYSRCINEADMLESHIIQARAQAATTERQAYERMMEGMGEFHDHQIPIIVKSAFVWCVDNELLRRNNLISPQDYLTTEKTYFKAPPAKKSNPAKPTIAFTMHVSKEPQDDGYTVVPGPEKAAREMDESSITRTFESSSDDPKRSKISKEKPNQNKPKPKWKKEPSAKDREEGWEKRQKLQEQHTNPRPFPPKDGTSLVQRRAKAGKKERMGNALQEKRSNDDSVPVFIAQPSVVVFTDYTVGYVYETTLELKNATSVSRRVRLIPPTTPYFSIGLGRFPGEDGIVAPGMSCKYTVRFAPDSLGNYEDFIVVEAQAEHLFAVPIAAARPPPVLTLPKVLDCGFCFIGGVKFVEFFCENIGLSAGTFCIIPKNQWPASNLRSVEKSFFSEQPPFAISPSVFVLQPGEAMIVEVVFFPTTADRSRQDFTLVCDNCQVKDISIEGEGEMIALKLVSVSGEEEPPVSGEMRDLTAEHFVRFSPCNPHSVQERRLIVRNNVHLELPYHWQIMKPNLHPLLPGETPKPSLIQFHPATDDAFHISPMAGVLSPCKEEEFVLSFCPKELKDYHSVCHLVVRDCPELPTEPSEDGVLQPLRTGSKVSDVIVMEIEVKGSTEPYQFLLDPYAIVIPGEILICTTTRRQFKMWNHSKTCISFQWEGLSSSSSHVMEVEPSAGRIEENECFDFDLIVIGGKPEKLVTSLVCHIQHCDEPVTLAVEVSFKGPVVTPGVSSVDLGLIKLGEQKQTTLLLTNTSPLEANWALEEKSNSQQDPQITVEPCRGLLPPLASCSVDVIFVPSFCQQYDSELELTVENGTGCHLSVRADVRSPQVCLLNCELCLSELFIGVPAKTSVTLSNQTLLPTDFSWMSQLQGKQADMCSASFEPSSGTLGPNANMDITVTFTSHTDLELTEVAALCEVQDMNCPLVLSIAASKIKKLSVCYSLPSAGSTLEDKSPSSLLLNFGDDVVLKRAVAKQFLITNQSAIPAPFTIEAEYFKCHVSSPSGLQEKRLTYKKPLHSVQAKKIEEKAQEDFVSSLLAHGKGAAFFILPASGMLGAFESQTVDVTVYTDMWGEYRDHLVCKVGDLDATLIPMQMTVKGCPLYFQMTGPCLDNQTRGPTLQFGSHVSGGDTVSRSLRINNPSMFDIRMDWETYNINENDRTLETRGGSSPEKEDSEVLSGESRDSDGDIQAVKEGSSEGARTPTQSSTDKEENINKAASEGEETYNLSDYPYCITPQQTVIPAKSSSTVHVSFTPLTLSGSVCESKCVGLALGFLSLDSELAACVPGKVIRAQGSDLEPVRVDLLAVVKPALLCVQMEEDEGVLEFRASAGDLLRMGQSKQELVVHEFDTIQSLKLLNNSEMPLYFKLRTQPPFSVLKLQPRVQTSTSSNPQTGDSQTLVLRPQHCVQVKVAFHVSLSLLDQADEEDPLGVTLISSESGRRKLRFQQNLQIHHSNNTLQTVPLCARLDLATIRLSTDSIDFGFCYVGQTQTVAVNLYGYGAHTYWRLNIESDVFEVTPDFGLLRSKERHVGRCSQSLQISFTPSENREFKSTVVIHSPLVKTPISLQLQGVGSFDEVHRSC
ncbi:LOW QUALITY PROTEIN: deleted in lung and esophageal cancer protein 1 [Xyrichtys novacula]|uniref:LOW QUALITY PROTEIN: deleted in lung and esophageal cancer protein 1 n=1 Tax=Xyrichtys novacula TaxID=13765 RepID=A0AAV1H837_XYRNO|nr:LOW QUALITY PROTEIN: deleted in lung and esophageal cancer protein 1 [Xyrichtys novacula]